MSFPRLAIHTGNTVIETNNHPEWEGTIVLQHNETTATILKYGPNMPKSAKKRHALLSTFQSNCEAGHWAGLFADNFFGQVVNNGVIPPVTGEICLTVQEPIAHE